MFCITRTVLVARPPTLQALGWSQGVWTWSTLHYSGHIACIIVYIMFKFVPSAHKREEKRETKKTK
ncbi:hypothetical protein EON67_12440 [archaeon]|nr:MAG: hypothetical protein EON67_12440 [archaeon]